jgi:hypothetical protein
MRRLQRLPHYFRPFPAYFRPDHGFRIYSHPVVVLGEYFSISASGMPAFGSVSLTRGHNTCQITYATTMMCVLTYLRTAITPTTVDIPGIES